MKRLPPLAALFAILALLGAACGGGSDAEPAAAEMPVSAPTLPSGEVIPTEALPDPLPEPYLFRDTAVIEEQVQSEVIYVVTAGDTLAGIASGFCVTVEEIQRLNNIVDVAAIGVGDELRIPVREGACGGAAPSAVSGSSGGAETQQPAEPQRRPGEVYVVESGDTLAEIAAAYGFGWRDIADYNGLSDAEASNLQVGQELVIPPAAAQPAEEPEPAEEERAEPPG